MYKAEHDALQVSMMSTFHRHKKQNNTINEIQSIQQETNSVHGLPSEVRLLAVVQKTISYLPTLIPSTDASEHTDEGHYHLPDNFTSDRPRPV